MRVNNSSLIPKQEYPKILLGNYIGISTAVFSCIGIVANILVFAVLTISQGKRFSTYRFLISHLTLADLICAIFSLAYVPIELNSHNWVYADSVCKVIYPSITFSTNLSIGTILIIALERYRGVIFPYCKAWNKKNISIGIVIIWLVSALIIVPNVMVIKVTSYSNLDYCNEVWMNETIRKLYGISFFFIAFFIPLIAIGYMNIHIILRLKYPEVEAANSVSKHRIDKRITRVLSVIVIAFCVCILPNKLLYFVWDLRPDLEKATNVNVRTYLRTIIILFYARVAIDPLLYCFFDTRFRKNLTNTIKRVRGQSFFDSDIYSRTRSRSNLSKQQRISLQFDQRSRCGTTLSVDDASRDFSSEYFHSKNIINENNDVFRNQIYDNMKERQRSISDLVSASTSPLVKPSFMTNLENGHFNLKQINNTSPKQDINEREVSESSCDTNYQNSVYGSAMPLV